MDAVPGGCGRGGRSGRGGRGGRGGARGGGRYTGPQWHASRPADAEKWCELCHFTTHSGKDCRRLGRLCDARARQQSVQDDPAPPAHHAPSLRQPAKRQGGRAGGPRGAGEPMDLSLLPPTPEELARCEQILARAHLQSRPPSGQDHQWAGNA